MTTRTRTKTVMTQATHCFSGSFLTGAIRGTIQSGERVRVTERIEKPLYGGNPVVRVITRDKRWAWVPPYFVQVETTQAAA